MKQFSLFINIVDSHIKVMLFDQLINPIDQIYYETRRDLIDVLLDKLELMLTNNKIEIKDINKIYFVDGPGNYTGVRAINIFVKLFASQYSNINFYKINYLQLWLYSKPVLLDAKGQKFYCLNKTDTKINIVPMSEINDIERYFVINVKNTINWIDNFKNKINEFIRVDEIKNLEANYVRGPL